MAAVAPARLLPAERVIEERELRGILHPLGFTIREIPPDGHCLYRSLGEGDPCAPASAAALQRGLH